MERCANAFNGRRTRTAICMSEVDANYMARALELARRARDEGEVPVGALVVVGDYIVGEGWNRPISSRDPSAHAEIAALRDAAQNLRNYRLPGATLYVTIEPCTMCLGALVHARIERLVFGAREPRAGVIVSNGSLLRDNFFNHQFAVDGGVREEECAQLMTDFFRRRRATTQ